MARFYGLGTQFFFCLAVALALLTPLAAPQRAFGDSPTPGESCWESCSGDPGCMGVCCQIACNNDTACMTECTAYAAPPLGCREPDFSPCDNYDMFPEVCIMRACKKGVRECTCAYDNLSQSCICPVN